MRRSAPTTSVRRRLADAEAVVAKQWLAHVTTLLGDELRRHPEAVQRAVIMRLHDLRQRQGSDPAARRGEDLATIVMRAVREISPAIADAVEQRLGVNMTDRDEVT
jgi:hypothetical protein